MCLLPLQGRTRADWSQCSGCGICSWQSGSETFFPSPYVFPFYYYSTTATYSSDSTTK